jgi:hypothetical protein
MEAIQNITDKITGKGDDQRAGVTNSAAVRATLCLSISLALSDP